MRDNSIFDAIAVADKSILAFHTKDVPAGDGLVFVQIADLMYRDEIKNQLDRLGLRWAWSDNSYITTLAVLVPEDQVRLVKTLIRSSQGSRLPKDDEDGGTAEQGLD